MNLDDPTLVETLDPSHLIDQIAALPAQIDAAYTSAAARSPVSTVAPRSVVLCGMGTSGVVADILAAYAAHRRSSIPISAWHNDGLPAWVRGDDTLVVCISYSGDTEETLSAYDAALVSGCSTLVIGHGGELMRRAEARGVPVWRFTSESMMGAATGCCLGLGLAALARSRVIADPEHDLSEMLHAMRNIQTNLSPASPVILNPAKRMAGQMVGRMVTIYASDYLLPVARRWRQQINELAKTWAQVEEIPNTVHFSPAGMENPQPWAAQLMALFLEGSDLSTENRKRLTVMRQFCMLMGINTDVLRARGDGVLAQMGTAMLFGDYSAYYLALAYGADPARRDALNAFRAELAELQG